MPLAILAVGVGLVRFAVLLSIKASRPEISRSFVLFVVIYDNLWVLLSIILVLTNWVPFTLGGKWAVGIVAAIMDFFATLQRQQDGLLPSCSHF